jgi:hypothetical protein
MTTVRGGRHGREEEDESQGEVRRQEAGFPVLASGLRSEDGTAEEDREEEVTAAAV